MVLSDNASPVAALFPGWIIHAPIGEGSFGTVWLAQDTAHTWCALKVVQKKSEDPATFDKEKQATLKYRSLDTQHMPHSLIRIREVRDSETLFAYAMPLADPERPHWHDDPAQYQPTTLATKIITQKALPIAQCLDIAIDLAEGLEFLQRHALVHRDLKPANILFIHGRAVIADIGLLNDTRSAQTLVGTPGYIPEENQGHFSGDIYSLGVLLRQISTGLPPNQPQGLPVEEADTQNPKFAPWKKLIDRACDKNFQKRPQTATSLLKNLRTLQTTALSPFSRLWKILLLLLLLFAASIWLTKKHTSTIPEAPPAISAAPAIASEAESKPPDLPPPAPPDSATNSPPEMEEPKPKLNLMVEIDAPHSVVFGTQIVHYQIADANDALLGPSKNARGAFMCVWPSVRTESLRADLIRASPSGRFPFPPEAVEEYRFFDSYSYFDDIRSGYSPGGLVGESMYCVYTTNHLDELETEIKKAEAQWKTKEGSFQDFFGELLLLEHSYSLHPAPSKSKPKSQMPCFAYTSLVANDEKFKGRLRTSDDPAIQLPTEYAQAALLYLWYSVKDQAFHANLVYSDPLGVVPIPPSALEEYSIVKKGVPLPTSVTGDPDSNFPIIPFLITHSFSEVEAKIQILAQKWTKDPPMLHQAHADISDLLRALDGEELMRTK